MSLQLLSIRFSCTLWVHREYIYFLFYTSILLISYYLNIKWSHFSLYSSPCSFNESLYWWHGFQTLSLFSGTHWRRCYILITQVLAPIREKIYIYNIKTKPHFNKNLISLIFNWNQFLLLLLGLIVLNHTNNSINLLLHSTCCRHSFGAIFTFKYFIKCLQSHQHNIKLTIYLF